MARDSETILSAGENRQIGEAYRKEERKGERERQKGKQSKLAGGWVELV